MTKKKTVRVRERNRRDILNDVQWAASLHLEKHLLETATEKLNLEAVKALAQVIDACHGPVEIPLSLGVGVSDLAGEIYDLANRRTV